MQYAVIRRLFRYRDERDLDAWFRLLAVLLAGVLAEVRLRLG